MTAHKPQLGEFVHYTSFGTPKGEYSSQCRAAIVTEVGQWVTVDSRQPDSFSKSEGRPIRINEQWFFDDAVALFVMNPTGVFFNGPGEVGCRYDEPRPDHAPAGGTWHYHSASCR